MNVTAEPTALVLSGGGARGAYEAGVLAGLGDVLGARSPLFDVLSGASVGAINAAYLAAHADRADNGVRDLVGLWTSLQLGEHLRPRLVGFAGEASPRSSRWGRALLDPRPFEALISRRIPWERVHANIRSGLVHALVVSALDISAGKTNTFVELAPTAHCVPLPPHDPRRVTRIESITADHVLASAALPFLFPARRVGGSYYCDGGLRFNTPMAPAIRTGAAKLVVIPLRAMRTPPAEMAEPFPNAVFLIGKILDALLHDPIDYDLQVLERFNRILDVMASTVPHTARERIAEVVEAERGLPYRRVYTLVFRPTENIGVLALEHLRRHGTGNAGLAAKLLLDKAASLGAHVEADFLSFVLFDGGFAKTLIELGRRDVRSRAAEVEEFFAKGTPP